MKIIIEYSTKTKTPSDFRSGNIIVCSNTNDRNLEGTVLQKCHSPEAEDSDTMHIFMSLNHDSGDHYPQLDHGSYGARQLVRGTVIEL